MSRRQWTKPEVLALIRGYKLLPALWDRRNQAFKDRDERRKAISKLAAEFQTTECEISRKIHNLRNQFFNQDRLLIKKVGSGCKNVTSCWEYFDYLKFLLPPHLTEEQRNIYCKEVEQQIEDGDVTNEFEDNISHNSMLGNTKSTIQLSNTQSPNHNRANEGLIASPETSYNPKNNSNINQQKYDEYKMFGEYVATELRKMHSQQMRNKLKRSIQMSIIKFTDMDDCQKSLAKSINEMKYQQHFIVHDLTTTTHVPDASVPNQDNNIEIL